MYVKLVFLQGGFYCNGLNPILNKLVGVHRNFMDSYSEKPMRDFIADLLIPLQSGSVDLGSIAEEIKEIIEKVRTRVLHLYPICCQTFIAQIIYCLFRFNI